MLKHFSFKMDKKVKSNLICLFISVAILMAIAFKDQNACGASRNEAHKGQTGISGFMIRHMFPCDAMSRTSFGIPSELAPMVGGDVPPPRTMGTLSTQYRAPK